MDRIQTALVIIGVLALLEGVWGTAAPGSIKRIVGWFVTSAAPAQRPLGLVFLLCALVLLVVVLLGQQLSAWILLAVALALAGFGLLCFREGGLQKLLTAWITNRGAAFVRAIYLVELVAALLMIAVALAGK